MIVSNPKKGSRRRSLDTMVDSLDPQEWMGIELLLLDTYER